MTSLIRVQCHTGLTVVADADGGGRGGAGNCPHLKIEKKDFYITSQKYVKRTQTMKFISIINIFANMTHEKE